MKRLFLLLAATALSYLLGLAVGSPVLLPLLNAAPAWWLMAERLRAGDRRGAVLLMLAWAVALGVLGTLAFAFWPTAPDAVVAHGPEYRAEMFHWIRTGEGSEGNWRLFLPQHVLHLAAFVALCLASASTLGILLGAVLMNYMDFYVASLYRAGVPGWAATLLGWQPWAICRVAAFCTLGAVLAEPLLSRLRPYAYAGLRAARPWLLAAAAGIGLDWLLKALLAPAWGLWLRGLLP